MGNTNPIQPPWLVDEVLGTGRLPRYFFGVILYRLQVIGSGGTALIMYKSKRGGIHSFLGRLTVEVDSFPGLAGLALLGVEQDEGACILHSFLSVLVGPYNLDR